MRESHNAPPASMFAKLARVSYMFLVLNASAVAGMVSAIVRRKVWR